MKERADLKRVWASKLQKNEQKSVADVKINCNCIMDLSIYT